MSIYKRVLFALISVLTFYIGKVKINWPKKGGSSPYLRPWIRPCYNIGPHHTLGLHMISP